MLPFLVIDMIVATLTMSMGMMMLPPSVISLPVKILFFVLVDGWSLLVGSLVRSTTLRSSFAQVGRLQMDPLAEESLMTILNTSVSGMLADSDLALVHLAERRERQYDRLQEPGNRFFDASSTQVSSAPPTVAASNEQRNLAQRASGQHRLAPQTSTNLAVQGSGFFVVSNSSGDFYLTRNGSFVPDASGNLVNSAGYYLMANDVQSGVGPAGQCAEQPAEGQCRQRRPDRRRRRPRGSIAGQSAFDGDADRRRRPAIRQFGEFDLHRRNLARRLRQPRRRPHRSISTSRTRAPTPGRSTPSTLRRRHPVAASPTPPDPLGDGHAHFDPASARSPSGSPHRSPSLEGQTISLDLSNTTQLAASFSVSSATANGDAPASLSGVSIAHGRHAVVQLLQRRVDRRLRHPARQCREPGQSRLPSTATPLRRTRLRDRSSSDPPARAALARSIRASLESSTVDLATELTDMIQAQSAYEANSKVFQTGANILDVLNNLKS